MMYLMGDRILQRDRFMQLHHCTFDPMKLITIFTKLGKFNDMWQNLDTVNLLVQPKAKQKSINVKQEMPIRV